MLKGLTAMGIFLQKVVREIFLQKVVDIIIIRFEVYTSVSDSLNSSWQNSKVVFRCFDQRMAAKQFGAYKTMEQVDRFAS